MSDDLERLAEDAAFQLGLSQNSDPNISRLADDWLADNGPVMATALAEAQATNARQQALLDRALESNGDMQATIARLEAALREKDEALKPFADQSKHFDEGAVRMGFAPSFDEYRPAVSFTHGELRAARRAYDALPAALTPPPEE